MRRTEQSVHQNRAQDCRETQSGNHVQNGTPGVLHAAHPAVTGHRQQDQRHPTDRDAQPVDRLGGHLTTAGEHLEDPGGGHLHDRDDDRTHRERDPRGLQPLAHRAGSVACAELLRSPGRRAVRQERELGADNRQDEHPDTERCEVETTKPADNGQIEHQVQRLGHENNQSRGRQPQDSAVGGSELPDGRFGHTERNNCPTTSVAVPVAPYPAASR